MELPISVLTIAFAHISLLSLVTSSGQLRLCFNAHTPVAFKRHKFVGGQSHGDFEKHC